MASAARKAMGEESSENPAVNDEEIARLLDHYLALADTSRNESLLRRTWLRPNLAYLADIGVPQPGVVPILAVPQLSMWARKMGHSVAELFTDPRTYLEVFLSREIGRFTQIQDDRPLNRRVVVALGVGFESSLFGAQQLYSPTESPWVDRTPVIQTPQDLDRRELPDFRKSGLMPLAHRFYEELSVLVQGYDMEIVFPDWIRSAFGVAVHLRGLAPLLIDMLERPELVRRLLGFLTDSAIQYRRARAAFLGMSPDRPLFHNDEVNVPSISPGLYRRLVLPVEKQYAAAFGGLTYWHSCGDATPMISAIREIPDIAIFHVGPWTDVGQAAAIFGDVTLDICLDSLDVYQASEEAMRTKVNSILRRCREHGAQSFSIRPGILQAFGAIEEDLASIARWVREARETVGEWIQ